MLSEPPVWDSYTFTMMGIFAFVSAVFVWGNHRAHKHGKAYAMIEPKDDIIIAKVFEPSVGSDGYGYYRFAIPPVGATIWHDGATYKVLEVNTKDIQPMIPGETPKLMAEFKVMELT